MVNVIGDTEPSSRQHGAHAVAICLVLVLVGACTSRSDESRPPATESIPTPPPTPTPIPSLPEGALESGTYVLKVAPGGAFDASHRITVSVPSGYEGLFGWMVLGPDTSLNLGTVDNVFADPCRWSGMLLDPPVGPRVNDLVAALANQPGHATTPTDVTLDGYAGKQMELTTPTDLAHCDEGEIRSWTFAPGESDYRSLEPGQHNLLWILDVDGVRLVLDVSYLGASAEDQAELLQMVDSIQINPR